MVIGIFVPEVNNGNKPVYFKSQSLPQGAFRRMGSSDVRCTEDDLLVLYQQLFLCQKGVRSDKIFLLFQ